jgi:multidrug transporter EmrE-like cation transporter
VLLNWFHVGIFICIAATALASLIVLARRKKQLEVVLALAVGVTFGVSMVLIKLMTSYLALNGKDVELLNCLLNPITPFIIANNILGLVILQIAFQNGRAAVIVPIQVSVISAIAVLAGIFLFSETVSIYRLLCISFIITGTALLQFASSVKRSLA